MSFPDKSEDNDPTIDYVNSIVNGSDNAQELDVNITNSPPPSRAMHSTVRSDPIQSTVEKKLERLERMLCTTFDAVRQLSHQVHS